MGTATHDLGLDNRTTKPGKLINEELGADFARQKWKFYGLFPQLFRITERSPAGLCSSWSMMAQPRQPLGDLRPARVGAYANCRETQSE